MNWDFKQIEEEIQNEAKGISSQSQLESFRIKYLGKKGLLAQIYASLAVLPVEKKPVIGKQANNLRKIIEGIIKEKKKIVSQSPSEIDAKSLIDVTIPGVAIEQGHKHILTQTIDEICALFERLGFVIHEGPEIETEFHNFTALNIPADHPSRDAFDTFYLEQEDKENKGRNLLLRSHTSPGQIRIMKQNKPPFAVVIPGRVYRPDAVDASHSFMFHQIEGLLVDKDVKFSHLKGLLSIFCKRFFGEDIKMRLRPHFFPFTEPSAEVDISCYICKGNGCSVCGRKGWLEIMGCGLVHPKVFEAAGYKKNEYTGLAFGLGVERIAMLKYDIHDIRLFYENDKRFLVQF